MAGVNNVAGNGESKVAACNEDVVWQRLKSEFDLDRSQMRRTADGGYSGMTKDGRYDVYVKGGRVELIDYFDTVKTEDPTPVNTNLCDPNAVVRLRQALKEREKIRFANAKNNAQANGPARSNAKTGQMQKPAAKPASSDKAARTRGAVEWRVKQGAQIVGTAAADKLAEKNPRAAGILRGALRLLGK